MGARWWCACSCCRRDLCRQSRRGWGTDRNSPRDDTLKTAKSTLLDRNDASFFSTLTPDTGRLRKLHPTSGHGRDARQHTISCRQDQIPYTTLIEQVRASRLYCILYALAIRTRNHFTTGLP